MAIGDIWWLFIACYKKSGFISVGCYVCCTALIFMFLRPWFAPDIAAACSTSGGIT